MKYKSMNARLLQFDIEERRLRNESLYIQAADNGKVAVWTTDQHSAKMGTPDVYLGEIPSHISGNSLIKWLEHQADSVVATANLAYDVEDMREDARLEKVEAAEAAVLDAENALSEWLKDALISPDSIASYWDAWDFLAPAGDVVDQVFEDVGTNKFSSLAEWAKDLAERAAPDALVDPEDLERAAETALEEWLSEEAAYVLEDDYEADIDENEEYRVILAHRLLGNDSPSVGEDLNLEWQTPPVAQGQLVTRSFAWKDETPYGQVIDHTSGRVLIWELEPESDVENPSAWEHSSLVYWKAGKEQMNSVLSQRSE